MGRKKKTDEDTSYDSKTNFEIPGRVKYSGRGRKKKIDDNQILTIPKEAISGPIVPKTINTKNSEDKLMLETFLLKNNTTANESLNQYRENNKKLYSHVVSDKENDASDLKKNVVDKISLVVYIGTNHTINDTNLIAEYNTLAKEIKKLAVSKVADVEVKATISIPKKRIDDNSSVPNTIVSHDFDAVISKSEAKKEGDNTILKLTLNTQKKTVIVNGVFKKMTGREFSLLKELTLSPGDCISREDLLTQVWSPKKSDGSYRKENIRAVDVHVRRLRKKIGSDLIIKTVRGKGYRFDEKTTVSFI